MADRAPDWFDPAPRSDPPPYPPPDPSDLPAGEATPYDEPDASADETTPPADADATTCPNCGMPVDPAADATDDDDGAPGLLRCPICGEQFYATAAGFVDDDAGADEEDEEGAAYREAVERRERSREQELNELRIRQIVQLRRGLYRARSYLVAAAGTCFVLVLHLAWKAYDFARVYGVRPRLAGYLAGVVVIGMLGAFFVRRIRAANAELAVPALDEPEVPPDFSTLSDGSYQWKNLERFAGARGDATVDDGGGDDPRAS